MIKKNKKNKKTDEIKSHLNSAESYLNTITICSEHFTSVVNVIGTLQVDNIIMYYIKAEVGTTTTNHLL